MNAENQKLWRQLMSILNDLAEAKFTRGVAEHGHRGLITDLSYEELEQAELEELIDLLHYRMAKIWKRQLK